MYLIVYDNPIIIKHIVSAKGLAPLDVLVTVKYSRHILAPLKEWLTLLEHRITIEKAIMNIPIAIELVNLSRDDFDVWYLEIFTTVTDRVKKSVQHRTGPWGFSLGGIPPVIWTPKIAFSDDMFMGERPAEIEPIKIELGAVLIGEKPLIGVPKIEFSERVSLGTAPQIGKPELSIVTKPQT